MFISTCADQHQQLYFSTFLTLCIVFENHEIRWISSTNLWGLIWLKCVKILKRVDNLLVKMLKWSKPCRPKVVKTVVRGSTLYDQFQLILTFHCYFNAFSTLFQRYYFDAFQRCLTYFTSKKSMVNPLKCQNMSLNVHFHWITSDLTTLLFTLYPCSGNSSHTLNNLAMEETISII